MAIVSGSIWLNQFKEEYENQKVIRISIDGGRVASLNSQVAKSAGWVIALKGFMRVMGLLSTILLARLLDPEDFGLIAITMAFIALIEIFGNFSFDTVLIQKRDATPADYNTAWSFNASFGILACITVATCSGWVADFYGDARIEPVMLVLSGLFLISGLQNIGVVEFRKNLTFEKEFRYQVLPKLISFFTTLGLAFWLKNYWALVFGSLIWKFLVLINSYLLHDFRPRFTYSEWRHLFRFSKWLMINNIFYFLNNRSPGMIVGKIISPEAAGFFTIAQEVSTLPTSDVAANITAATYPGYCKISHLPVELKKLYLTVMESISFFVIPAGVGISMVAHVLVPVVLGPKWTDAIPLVQLIALSGALMAMSSNTGAIFMAMGRPRVSTMMGLFRFIVSIPLILWMASILGLEGVALAILGSSLLIFIASTGLVHFGLKVPLISIFKVYFRPMAGSFLMAGGIHFVSTPLDQYAIPQFLMLFLLVLLGVIFYVVGVGFLWRLANRPNGPEKNVLQFIARKFKIEKA